MIDYKAIESAVEKYAPLLSSVITETNPIAGLVIMAIAKVFDTDPDDITTQISVDANASSKLKQLQDDQQDILVKYQTEDTQNARDREEKVIELTGKRDWVLDIIAMLVVLGFFYIMWYKLLCTFA